MAKKRSKVRRPALHRKLVSHGMSKTKARRIANKPSKRSKG